MKIQREILNNCTILRSNTMLNFYFFLYYDISDNLVQYGNLRGYKHYYVMERVNVRGSFICFRSSLFRCRFSAFGMAIGLFLFFLPGGCVQVVSSTKIAFNRLCQLWVVERNVASATSFFLFLFFLFFLRDRAARRNLSRCPFYFSFFLSSDFHDVHQIFIRNFPVFEQCEFQDRIRYYSNNSLFN